MKKLILILIALGNITAFAQDWIIDAPSKEFPANFRLQMNNVILTDTCAFPEETYVLHKDDGRTEVHYVLYGAPKAFKLEIINRGGNCGKEVLFFSKKVRPERRTDNSGNPILYIKLD